MTPGTPSRASGLADPTRGAGVRRRGRGLPHDVRTTVLSLAVLSLILGGVLWLIGSLRQEPWVAFLVVVLGALVASLAPWAISRTGGEAERAYWTSTPRQEAVAPTALDYRIVKIRRDLRDSLERDDRPDSIAPLLRELAAERLRAHHDIDLDAEPERAQAVMTPELWRYLNHPPGGTRRRHRSVLHTAIEGIEQL